MPILKLKYFALFLVILELSSLVCVGYRIGNVNSDELVIYTTDITPEVTTESTTENSNTPGN